MVSAATMIQILPSCLAQISKYWSFACANHNEDKNTAIPSSTLTSTTDSSSSTNPSPTMKKRKSYRRKPCARPINQLVKAVSPYDELRLPEEQYPYDEKQGRQDNDEQRLRDRNDRVPSEIIVTMEIPKIISFPVHSSDDDSAFSVEDNTFKEERLVTPHPACDEGRSLAKYSPYMYHASRQVGDHDWPSDEDDSLHNPATSVEDWMMTTRSVD